MQKKINTRYLGINCELENGYLVTEDDKKKRKKREAEWTSKKLMPWLKYNLLYNFAGEVKYITIKEKNYNYKGDKSLTKEIRNLKIAGRRLVYKNPDTSLAGTPFDLFAMSAAQGIFFFAFEANKKQFYCITVDDLEKEINSGVKSLTEERAREIAFKIGELK